MNLSTDTRYATQAFPERTRPIRVAFCGDIANNFYQIAKALRRWEDLDAHLFIDCETGENLPESDDPELRGNYPHWIHTGRPRTLRERVFPWQTELVRQLADFDIVVASGGAPSLASFTRAPVAFYATGHDLTVAPFLGEAASRQASVVPKLKALWVGAWQRRGIRRCEELWVAPYEPFQSAVRRLAVPDARVSSTYFPLIIDTERFGELPPESTRESSAVREIVSRFDFWVFHPSRLMINATPGMRASGDWKGNDTLLRAFARFLELSGNPRAGLVLIERYPSPDVDAAKRLVRELGIEQNVLWLKPPRSFGFTRAELVAIYSAADVVADDFGAGWFGSVVLEGLTARRPVLCYVNELAMRRMYPWHPLLSSNTVEGNAELMLKLSRDPALRREKGEAGRRWIDEFHAPESAGRVYAEHIRQMAARLGVRPASKV